MLETITGNKMAIKDLTKQDLLVIDSMTKAFSNEVWKLKKKYENDPAKKDLFAPLYNLKDLVMLRLFDYYMPIKSTDKIREILDKIYKADTEQAEKSKTEEEKQKEQEQKDDIILLISSAMGVNNNRFKETATDEERKLATALYTDHFKSHVFFTTNPFAYQNEFDTAKKSRFHKSTRTTKDASKNVISESVSQLGTNKDKADEKTSFINDEILGITNGSFNKIFTTLADEYFSIYSTDYNIDIRISIKDGIPYVKSGKVKLGAGVELVEASGEVKAEPTPVAPIAAKPTQIEQPKPVVKPKPAPAATPVAPAKPTPAPVAKPEPAVSKAEAFLATVAVATEVVEAVDADEDEQAMLDELPEDL